MTHDLLTLMLQQNLLINILAYSADIGKCAIHLTTEIREMVGARIVTLFELGEGGNYTIAGCCPQRRQQVFDSTAGKVLIKAASTCVEPAVIRPGEGESGKCLEILGMNDSFVIPLRDKGETLGMILILDLIETKNTDHILEGLKSIAGMLSLILRNSFLYRNMEALIEQKTKNLQESEEKYRLLFDNAGDIILYHDLAGNILDGNQTALDKLGYTKEELIRLSLRDINAEDESADLGERLAKLKENGFIAFETVDITKTGERFPTEIHARLFSVRGENRVMSVSRDITERKKMEIELGSQQELLAQVEKLGNIGGWSFIPGQEEQKWTAETFRIHEMDENAPTPKASEIIHFIVPEYRKSALAEMERAIEFGEPFDHVMQITTAKGKRKWVRSVAKVQTENGKTVKISGAFQDISKQKLAEEALEKRMLALTAPLESAENLEFEELFNLEDIQRLQDDFCEATGVGSIITKPNGTPITKPGNFCSLCRDVIRATEQGRENCWKSDSSFSASNNDIQIKICGGSGLWDAGARITVGGRHIANWLIGQVRDDTQTEEHIRQYARAIGADEDAAARAFLEVPFMSRERFEKIAKMLLTLATQLSNIAFQNIQQARFITERKRAEEELAVKSHLLSRTELVSLTGSWSYDLVSKTAVWSEGVYKMFNISETTKPDAMVRMFLRRVHPLDRKNLLEFILGKNIRELTRTIEFRMRFPDGEVRWMHGYGEEVRSDKGKSLILSGYVQDITERKRAEEDRIARAAADEANKAKSNFISNMSHELRTPLNSVIALSGVLERRLRGKVGEEEYGYVNIIERNGKHLLDLINDILDISRIEAGREEIHLTEFEPAALLGEIINLIKPQADQKGIYLRLSDASSVRVTSDYDKYTHIFQNIIANAVKFTDSGGVDVEARIASTHAEEKRLIVTVSDTGIGIEESFMPYIFDEFRQADDTTTRKHGGTGLGLSIANKYANLLGGSISAKSEKGKGTVFTVTMPVTVKQNESAAPEAPAATNEQTTIRHMTTDGVKKTVLIVEDNADNRLTLKALLANRFEVLEAEDGLEGVEEAKRFLPDFILMDIAMPGMNGINALNALKTAPSTRDIPVIAVSASAMKDEREHYMQYGFDGFIAKPVDTIQFERVIGTFL